MKSPLSVVTICSALLLAIGCGGEFAPELDVSQSVKAATYDKATVPTCADLGKGSFSTTISPVTDGVHAFDATYGVQLTTFSGTWFNWQANLPIGAVIIPGGAGAKVYDYAAGVTANGGLSGAIDPNTNQPYALTSLTFCYDNGLKVYLDLLAKVKKTKQWAVQKSVDMSSVTVAAGQTHTANYTVVVSQPSIQDSDWSVQGTVLVSNPTGSAATITGVTGLLDNGGTVSFACPVSFPASLAAGASFTCTFATTLADGTTRTLDAVVATSGGISGGTAQRSINFAYAAASIQDSCVAVSDDLYGALGYVCYDQAPQTFTYSMTMGPYTQCGTSSVVNTASLVTNDTSTTASSSATVKVDLPCAAPNGPCDGKVTELTLRHDGTSTAAIQVLGKSKGDKGKGKCNSKGKGKSKGKSSCPAPAAPVIFSGTVQPGGLFTIYGIDSKGTLGTEITLLVNGSTNTQIHTSCSKPIGPGLVSGSFTVMAGSSLNGGVLPPL